MMVNRNDGKQFEILVRDLELLLHQHYGQTKVKSKWRYRVKGKNSGDVREVDVALFVESGCHTLFIAIECRDRKGKGDTPWIEQLASKRNDVNADRMVAVSRVGFTSGAKKTAKQEGIQLYTLTENGYLDGTEKSANLSITLFRPKVEALEITLSYYPIFLKPIFEPPKLSKKNKQMLYDFKSANWKDKGQDKTLSLIDIAGNNLTWDQLLEGVERDDPPVIKKIKVDLPRNRYFLNSKISNDVFLALATITGGYKIQWDPKLLTPDRIVKYGQFEDKPVIEMHEFDGKILGLKDRTLFIAHMAPDEKIDN